MNISEAAKLVGLSTKQIRDYEKMGLIKPAVRSLSGYRNYGESDLERLHFIRHSRDVGFPKRSSREVKVLTAQHIAMLNQQIEQLQKMVQELQRWHDNCQGNDSPECSILNGLNG